jgi:hypothetical protein
MIRHARHEIAKRARGGLGGYPAQYLATAYRQAREDAVDKTGLPVARRAGAGRGLLAGAAAMNDGDHLEVHASIWDEGDVTIREPREG